MVGRFCMDKFKDSFFEGVVGKNYKKMTLFALSYDC